MSVFYTPNSVGETVILALGYQVIADDAPGTTAPEGDQPVRTHSLLRLMDDCKWCGLTVTGATQTKINNDMTGKIH